MRKNFCELPEIPNFIHKIPMPPCKPPRNVNKNHMKDVAKLLGVDIEEEFKVVCIEDDNRDSNQGVYYFTTNDFKGKNRLSNCGDMLIYLLSRRCYKIEKS